MSAAVAAARRLAKVLLTPLFKAAGRAVPSSPKEVKQATQDKFIMSDV
jgi:hypothetical protein